MLSNFVQSLVILKKKKLRLSQNFFKVKKNHKLLKFIHSNNFFPGPVTTLRPGLHVRPPVVPPVEGNDDVAVLLTRSTLSCWGFYVGETINATSDHVLESWDHDVVLFVPCYSRRRTLTSTKSVEKTTTKKKICQSQRKSQIVPIELKKWRILFTWIFPISSFGQNDNPPFARI